MKEFISKKVVFEKNGEFEHIYEIYRRNYTGENEYDVMKDNEFYTTVGSMAEAREEIQDDIDFFDYTDIDSMVR